VVSLGGRARYVVAATPVFVIAMLLYWRTLLPDVGVWDTAEFQAIGPVLGIAHPTGYPTYTLLAWLASVLLQPFGNEAFRADLLSALLIAGAAALLAIATVQLTRRPLLGMVAGLLFAVTPVAWRVATRADAHALHAFLAALLLVLLIEWMRRERPRGDAAGAAPSPRAHAGRWLVAAALVYGLSLGNHALTLLLAPGIIAFVLLVRPNILWRRWRLVAVCLTCTAIAAIAVYAYLPIRSSFEPPLDYASPRTWDSFWYVVRGEQFSGSIKPLPSFADGVASVWDQLVRNIGLLVVLVPAGAVLGAFRHGRVIALTGLWFVLTWIFALGYNNASIERYYLVPLLAGCLWLALGADIAWDAARSVLAGVATDQRQRLTRLLAAALAITLVVVALAPVPGRFQRQDASNDTHGRDWLEAAFTAMEPGAAVVSWWSYSTPLWYGRWVEGRRADILIIDDRDVLDDGYGRAEAAVDRYLDERPVYIVRLSRDIPAFEQRYVLEKVESVPDPGDMYRVIEKRAEGTAEPT
jgi:4-amino-4-deoxy-L-arabinose transferase-like glycosyltransferase